VTGEFDDCDNVKDKAQEQQNQKEYSNSNAQMPCFLVKLIVVFRRGDTNGGNGNGEKTREQDHEQDADDPKGNQDSFEPWRLVLLDRNHVGDVRRLFSRRARREERKMQENRGFGGQQWSGHGREAIALAKRKKKFVLNTGPANVKIYPVRWLSGTLAALCRTASEEKCATSVRRTCTYKAQGIMEEAAQRVWATRLMRRGCRNDPVYF
jgi:hypothetical protein